MTMFLAPFAVIADLDGSPLDAGFLFLGEYGKDPEMFPVEVFWDADFEVPAAQPIRTRNGYPVRNGSSAKVYLKAAQHSIVIKNRNSAFVLVDFFNKGWDASLIVDGNETQHQINKRTVSSVYDYNELSEADVIDGQAVLVKKEGISGEFVYQPESVKLPDGGTVIKDSQNRTWERVDISAPKMAWWGAVGDNVADDTSALQAANAFFRTHKIYVDGDNKTYKSTTRGTWMRYLKNATVRVESMTLSIVYYEDGTYAQLTDGRLRDGGAGELYGVRFGACLAQDTGYSSGVYIGGYETLKNVTQMTSNILIGDAIMAKAADGEAPRFNIAIGDSAMTHAVNTGGGTNGTRNIAIGTLALHFMTNGSYNVAVGRNAAHNITDGQHNTAIGYAAGMQGTSPIGWTGRIEMQLGTGSGLSNTCIGSSAGQYGNGSFNTIIGRDAAPRISTANSNVIVGSGVGFNLDTNISYLGTTISYANTSGTYTISGSTVTVVLASAPAIGLSVGDVIGLACSTGDLTVESGKLTVTQVVNTTTFRFALPTEKAGATVGGNCSLFYHIKTTAPANSASGANVLLGRNAVFNKLTCQESIVLGGDAVGGTGEVLRSVAIGTRSLQNAVTCVNNTAVGHEALRLTIAGNVASTMTNCGGFGYQARISGDNQIQLGNSANTVYAYGAIQDRSDIRDKADIEEMPEVMTEFVLGLNPVQGVWDMRDDYVDELPEDWTDEQKREWWSNPQKDGAKKRNRRHNWFIAQEVKALADKLGVDFAGLQDHKLINGTDTLTIGYEEFIPPVVATLQRAWQRLDEIEDRLNALENL